MLPRLCVAVFLLAACDSRLAAKDYDQKCSVNADCMLVSEGEFCAACGPVITPAAINVAEAARYQRESDAIGKNGCPPRLGPLPPCAPPQEMPTVQLEAVCNAGTCEAHAL